MREESRAGRRHLHIMELCNGESSGPTVNSGTGENEPSPKQAASKKRHRSPEPGDAGTKRKRPDNARGTRAHKSRAKRGTTNLPKHIENNPDETRRDHDHSREPGLDSAHEDESSSPGHCHSRKRHNLVEKKYRQRLNTQFKQLLDILPTSPDTHTNHHTRRRPTVPSAIDDGMDTGAFSYHNQHHDNHQHDCSHDTREMVTDTADKRRVSKGEVLDRARLYIRALEREHRRLVAERRELELLRAEQACHDGGRRR